MSRRVLINSGSQKPNTFIGGVASFITTPLELKGYMTQITEGHIRKFNIVEDDIECKIIKKYNFIHMAFYGNNLIDSFDDRDGLCSGLGFGASGRAFMNSSIRYANFPGAVNLERQTFLGSSLEVGLFESFKNSTYPTAFLFANTPNLEELYCPNLKILYSNIVANTPKLEIFVTGDLTEIRENALSNSKASVNVEYVTVLGNGAFNQNYGQKILNFNSITNSQGNGSTLTAMSALKELRLNFTAEIPYTLANMTALEIFEIKKVKTWGDPVTRGTRFTDLKTGCLIKAHEDMSTVNSGNPHICLDYAKNTRGATVELYDDNGDYVGTL